MKNSVTVLQEGYCVSVGNEKFKADCTITLIKSHECGWILVDTGGPWNKDKLIGYLQCQGVGIDDITTVVCTHGHSDHVGNLNLFASCTRLIVGRDISVGDIYEEFDFEKGAPYKLAEGVEVIPTPGHTHSDVSVVVKDTELGTVVIAGDLFEKGEDRDNSELWKCNSENPTLQIKHREIVTTIADYIVPGHGPMFINDRRPGSNNQ